MCEGENEKNLYPNTGGREGGRRKKKGLRTEDEEKTEGERKNGYLTLVSNIGDGGREKIYSDIVREVRE